MAPRAAEALHQPFGAQLGQVVAELAEAVVVASPAERTDACLPILRPAWVMQNFSDEHPPVVQDMITVPTAGGPEAFVDAADVAAVAVETLVNPGAHASAVYAPTGPQALTVAEVADIIAGVVGRPVRHSDIDSA